MSGRSRFGFRGALQVDGYAGYRALAETGPVQLAFCWAHVRRRFYEIAATGAAPIATEALARIAALYAIETELRGRPADERRAVRQERTKPLVDDLKAWFEAKLGMVSQKSTIAEAIRYALSRWDGLCRFIEDGRIEIDSNIVERAIRPLALNRKNALFAGSDGGGEHWAILASMIETCKLNDVDPEAYLANIFHAARYRPSRQSPRRTLSLELDPEPPSSKGRVTPLMRPVRGPDNLMRMRVWQITEA